MMRRLSSTIFVALGLLSCSKPSSEPPTQQEQEAKPKKKASAGSADEPQAAKKSTKARVRAHDAVPRYDADAGWGWAKHDFMKRYSVAFPEELEFKVTEKKDHASHVASKVYKGTIYRVEVRDYSKSKTGGAEHKEPGFLKFSGSSEAKNLGATIAGRKDVELPGGGDPIAAHYMTYSWELEKEYFVDWLALNVGDHVIVLSTSSRPKYDAAARVEEFFNSFEVRE